MKKKNAFTLIEVMVYIVILVIIFVTIVSILLWSIKSNAKAKVISETINNAKRVMDVIGYEIREARSVYDPTSVFDASPGQLSLETTHYLPTNEDTTFIDLYLCGDQVCLKKESQDAVAFSADSINVENLAFTLVKTGDIASITVNLTASYENPNNRPEYDASAVLQSTYSLRSY